MSEADKPKEGGETPKTPEAQESGGFWQSVKGIGRWLKSAAYSATGLSWLKPEPKAVPKSEPKEGDKPADKGGHGDDKGDHGPGDKGHEKHETVDHLDLEVKGTCDAPGPYIGLGLKQREKLGLKEKDLVELSDDKGKSLGIFIVGKIKKEVLDATPKEEQVKVCTANVPAGTAHIVVKKTEKKIEQIENLVVKVLGKCKSEGSYIGMSEYTRLRFGVKVGDTICVAVGGRLWKYYTVGEITEEAFKKAEGDPNIVTINSIPGEEEIGLKGGILIKKKPELTEANLGIEYEVEKKAPEKRAAKIAEPFGKDAEVQPGCYITVPNPIAHELGAPYPKPKAAEKSEHGAHGKEEKPEKEKVPNTCMISKMKVQVGDKPAVPMIIVPSGYGLGFTTEAAKKLRIKAGQEKTKIMVKDGVLHVAESA